MEVGYFFLAIMLPLGMLWILYQLFVIVGDMASARGHNPWPWWLLSLAWSPFAVMFILWVFFDVSENQHQ